MTSDLLKAKRAISSKYLGRYSIHGIGINAETNSVRLYTENKQGLAECGACDMIINDLGDCDIGLEVVEECKACA